MRAAVFLSTLLLAGLCAAYQGHNNNRRGYNNNDNDQQDQQNQQQAQKAKPFRAGQKYSFTYNGQIASGLDVTGPSNAPVPGDEQQQKAVTRIQALAKIAFESDQRATLRLERIHLGQLNEPIDSPHQVKPMGMFEKKNIDQQNREKLEQPLQFEYSNGVVQRIQFHSGDSTWSKNIKRAVLQLIQLNLQRQSIRGGDSVDQWGPENAKQQYQSEEDQDQDTRDSSTQLKSFTLPEINIEGECQTNYVVNKNKGQSYGQQQSDEQQINDNEDDQQQSFNVTKSIDFKKCRQIADVAFGFQTQQLQPQCAKCQKQWYKQLQQQQSSQSSAQQPQACEVECDPKEIKEQKLDRSTVLRFVLAGKGPEHSYAIKRAELISQYIYKNLRSDNGAHSSTMQTIVAAELIFRSARPTQGNQGNQRSFQAGQSENGKDTLLYDNEFDVEEKKFYMNGDEESSRQGNSPFAHVTKKVEHAQMILRKLAQTASNKPIESTEAVQIQRLVELLRMCTTTELKEIFEQVSANLGQSAQQNSGQSSQHSLGQSSQHNAGQKIEEILADTLAIAGTRNTIKMLAEKIKNGQIKPQQAAQALKSLRGLPAPSDKQAESVLNLCQHDSVQRSPALKQACWLSFGAMVGELCQQTSQKESSSRQMPVFGAQTGFRAASQQCQSEKKQKYQQALMEQYQQAQTTYEKVLALKACGNAGIDTAVHQLEKIINNQQENRIVRAQAIDALRRLRTQMPRKIQRVLLPIFQNTREQPQVRMTAFAMLIHTTPEKPIMDQIAYTLTKERSSQVQSLVYSAMKTLSASKVQSQQQMAKHLKNALALTNVDEQSLQASRIYHVPIYSNEQKEGVFLNLVSVFSNRNSILPNHMAAVLDTMLNDEFELNSLKVALTQQGIEQWYEGLIQSVLYPQSGKGKHTRSQRSSNNYRKTNEDNLRQIFSGLKVQSRRRSTYRDSEEEGSDQQQQQQQGSNYANRQNQPFAMFTMRVGDMDTTILPIDRQSMPQCLKSLANGERPNIANCLEAMQNTKSFQSFSTMNLAEKSAKIPTSIGVPLRILQAMPVLASIEGRVTTNSDRSEGAGVKATLVFHPSVCVAHIQKMETWSPMISTGVQSHRALELNVPIQAEIQATSQGSLKATIKTPTSRTRLMAIHTLPTTCTRDFDSRAHLLKEPKCKTVRVPQLEQFETSVDYSMGMRTTGLPIRIRGHVHRPANLANYVEMVQLAMCSENHVSMHYEPESGDSPTEIILRAEASSFAKESKSGPTLDNFYSKNSQFDDANDQDFEDMDNHDQGRSKLNSFLNKFQAQFYKHQLKLSAQTKGGRKEVKAQVISSASCDAKFKFCRMEMAVERSPMYNENNQWTLRSQVQLLAPEAVSNVRQLQSSPSDKNQKLVVQGHVEWGSNQKQNIHVRVQGQKAHSKQWRQQINQFQGPQNMFQQKRAAFVNKFDVVADYKLDSNAQNVFQRCLEALKGRTSMWNTETLLEKNGRDSQVRCTVVIDPITLEHANISIKMPSQSVRIASMELPIQVRPFALVRQSNKASHSAHQLFSRMTEGQGRAECSVDGKRVETFDDVLYKAPIGKCYSVLAKDCSNEDQPQFVVMMKTTGQQQDKKIKVITPEQTIVCQPTQSSGSQKKLQCTVNGEEVNSNEERNGQDQQQQQDYNAQTVEYTNDEQTDVTINVRGVQVRFGCWGSNGCKQQKAWIKLSSEYKESQCGLCGHYDEQAEDELRMANNKQAGNLQDFHRSFTLQDSQGECTSQDQDQLYSKDNSRKFRQMGRDYQEEWDNQNDNDDEDQDFGFPSKAKNSKKSQKYTSDESQQEDDDQHWQAGAYHTDGSSSEEDQWGRGESQKRWKKQQQSQSRRANQQKRGNNQADNNDDQTEGEEPVSQTLMQEYDNKVCFSKEPVRQCPKGTHPASTDDQDNRPKKVPFVCLNRRDSDVRQMQKKARKGDILDLSDHQGIFFETVREPSRCVVY